MDSAFRVSLWGGALKVLALIPSLPKDLKQETVDSVFNQKFDGEIELHVLTEVVKGGFLGEKVSYVLNRCIEKLDLTKYDWILRLDGDTVLPSNFVKVSTSVPYDVGSVGKAGHCTIIRMEAFLSCMPNQRFDKRVDDSTLYFNLMYHGWKCLDWQRDAWPLSFRPPGIVSSLRYFLYGGKIRYIEGYEPVHVLLTPFVQVKHGSLVNKNIFIWRNFLQFYAYLYYAFFDRRDRYPFFGYVRAWQVRRLIRWI